MSTPSPGAPRTRDPERRRREILEAATEIAVARGPGALTHRAVSAQTGIPLGTITRHFPSIDALRESALSRLAAESENALDLIAADLARAADPAQRLAELAHEHLLEPHYARASLAMVTTPFQDEQLRDLSLRWTEQLTEILSDHCTDDAAEAVAFYLDGALIHSALTGRAPGTARLEHTLRALMTPSRTEDQ
ncbi:TetR family transcriptional regulator [Kocuria tytonicola]|uniref:TetR family transcriptional regulator n=1 Tax=Kocuria tytonicola TaxID=2055946 RepID=A0A3L9L959_9MICC|nr:TetR family transcriptional regulator [Kocuria tytonicola]RLY94724.1 TetR family transcriptional regulator [Kocuria tytonicola]